MDFKDSQDWNVLNPMTATWDGMVIFSIAQPIKQCLPMVIKFSGKTISFNFLHIQKADQPIEMTVLGITIFVSCMFDSNAMFPIESKLEGRVIWGMLHQKNMLSGMMCMSSGKMMLSKLSHPVNAPCSQSIPLGIFMFFNDLQFKNASVLICSTESGMFIDDNFRQLWNARSSMSRIVSGSVIFLIM